MQSQTAQVEVCPSCGEFAKLITTTGWCKSCSGSYCNRCGDPANGTSYCNYCRKIRWLERNAETIEDYMLEGQSFKEACLSVANVIRPNCIICDEPIERGTSGRHFICTKHPECRKARRRYRYLIYDKGYSKELAIEAITNGRQDGEGTG